jgi:putative membrane protein
MYERQSSQIVLQSTRDRRVRGFAQMMLRDHMNSTAKVKTAARQSGVRVPPPRLMPRQARMIAELRSARGADRDAVYVRQQRMAHEEALATHRDYASTGTARPLRRVATGIVPVVEHHLDMLRAM